MKRRLRVGALAGLRAHKAACQRANGFTLIELMLGASILAVIFAAMVGGYLGQAFLTRNARNLLAAMNDATRVMEQIRQQNIGTSCVIPSAAPPINPATAQPYLTWDDWLKAQNPAQSIQEPGGTAIELVAVTCQDGNNPGIASTNYCGDLAIPPNNPAQIGGFAGRGEWSALFSTNGLVPGTGRQAGQNTTFDPIRVTVAVGWWQQGRVIGGTSAGSEFTYSCTGAGKGCINQQLNVGPDANRNGVIESQAMLTTLVTCR